MLAAILVCMAWKMQPLLTQLGSSMRRFCLCLPLSHHCTLCNSLLAARAHTNRPRGVVLGKNQVFLEIARLELKLAVQLSRGQKQQQPGVKNRWEEGRKPERGKQGEKSPLRKHQGMPATFYWLTNGQHANVRVRALLRNGQLSKPSSLQLLQCVTRALSDVCCVKAFAQKLRATAQGFMRYAERVTAVLSQKSI